MVVWKNGKDESIIEKDGSAFYRKGYAIKYLAVTRNDFTGSNLCVCALFVWRKVECIVAKQITVSIEYKGHLSFSKKLKTYPKNTKVSLKTQKHTLKTTKYAKFPL